MSRFARAQRVRADRQAAETAWPEGVIARYSTVVGAAVDLIHEYVSEDAQATRATCTGCTESEQFKWVDGYQGFHGWVSYQNRERGDRAARKYAQSHAERCRALPRPGGAW